MKIQNVEWRRRRQNTLKAFLYIFNTILINKYCYIILHNTFTHFYIVLNKILSAYLSTYLKINTYFITYYSIIRSIFWGFFVHINPVPSYDYGRPAHVINPTYFEQFIYTNLWIFIYILRQKKNFWAMPHSNTNCYANYIFWTEVQ